MDSENSHDIRNDLWIALDLLRQKWGLETRTETLERLLNAEDPTLLQLAKRRNKLIAAKKLPPED